MCAKTEEPSRIRSSAPVVAPVIPLSIVSPLLYWLRYLDLSDNWDKGKFIQGNMLRKAWAQNSEIYRTKAMQMQILKTPCLNYSSHRITLLPKLHRIDIFVVNLFNGFQCSRSLPFLGEPTEAIVCTGTHWAFISILLLFYKYLLNQFLCPCCELLRQHSEMTTVSLLQPERIYKISVPHSNLCAFISPQNDIKFSIYGFRLFDVLIDVVSTFEFCHNITIWKMVTFDKVDYIEMNQH